MHTFPAEDLRRWFETEMRDLPWRRERTPYRVWVSEIMLQQTLASVVVDYFNRWMERFPTIHHVAQASQNELIKAWEGLGYYSRVKNLHEAAKQIVSKYDGQILPGILADLPGLGSYTVGAIRSFAFGEKAAAVDGNVLRVMSRYFLVEADIGKPKTKAEIESRVFQILPDENPAMIMEGLIELGARICQKKPLCGLCPLQNSCLAFAHGRASELPNKKKKKQITLLHRSVYIIQFGDEFLVRKEQEGKVMAGLYEFPYFQTKETPLSPNRMKNLIFSNTSSFKQQAIDHVIYRSVLPIVEHTFTRFRAKLYPSIWKALKKTKIDDYDWVERAKLLEYPFSSGHKKILNGILKDAYFTY